MSITTTVLEKSQLLKGFQVEQKYRNVFFSGQKNTRRVCPPARPTDHTYPTDAPPENPKQKLKNQKSPRKYTVHILLFTSLIADAVGHFYFKICNYLPKKQNNFFFH